MLDRVLPPPDAREHSHPEPLGAQRERGKWHLAALIAILLLATAVRFHDIARHPLWLDEFLALLHSAGQGEAFFSGHHGVRTGGGEGSLATSGVRTPPPDLVGRLERAPYPQIWRGMLRDVHPPLYQILLRVWRDAMNPLFGDGDALVRALGALLGVAGVAMLWDVVRLLHGPAPALWAALIMALAAPQIQWAQDARPYTLLILLALGAIDGVVRLERLGPGIRRAVALGACTLGAALTHYYALPALLAMGCYAAIRLRGRNRLQAGAALLGAVVLFLVMWGPTFVSQVRGGEAHSGYLVDSAPGHLGRTLVRLAVLPARSLNEPAPRVVAVACLGAILFVLPLLLRRRRPDLALWGWWMAGAVAPALTIDLLKQWEQLELLRYTSLATPAFYAMIAAVGVGGTLASRRTWLRHVLPAVAALSCIVSLPHAYEERQNPQPDYLWLAFNFTSHARSGDVLVFHHAHDRGSLLLWYMAMSWYMPAEKMPETVVFLMDEPSAAEAEVLRKSTNVWTVSEPGGTLPPAVSAGRVPGHSASGFNLPVLQQWVRPTTPLVFETYSPAFAVGRPPVSGDRAAEREIGDGRVISR
ncbi:MAG TPA: glycosyltransferase family 39 protein [Tepidisphaeraceae bacterium]|nr:glycosyltransferase family 39 protein [Tepidisphaeraceae bacterium]